MTYIKWKRGSPFVYKSERETVFTEVNYETVETSKVLSKYLGTYRKYREKRPNGRYTQIMTNEARLKMLSEHPKHAAILDKIDEEVYQKFENGRRR